MKTVILFLFLLSFAMGCSKPSGSNMPTLSSGSIERINNFKSEYITPRNVDVWLPVGYNKNKSYSVLYMNDGQMLFDSTITWNKQEWQVDEVVSKLLDKSEIKKCIVVAIWNIGQERHIDYFPQKPFEILERKFQDSLYKELNMLFPGPVHSDNYLKFLIEELKPYIDTHFSTLSEPENTFIMGSSMGGLISMYAICEYPNVFGGAGCLSTHWPGIFSVENNPIPDAFVTYLKNNLPDPDSHKIYFDYGTETLDKMYEPFQLKVDSVMSSKGFSETNWETRKFPGENHSEISWARRLDIPLKFLLGTPE